MANIKYAVITGIDPMSPKLFSIAPYLILGTFISERYDCTKLGNLIFEKVNIEVNIPLASLRSDARNNTQLKLIKLKVISHAHQLERVIPVFVNNL